MPGLAQQSKPERQSFGPSQAVKPVPPGPHATVPTAAPPPQPCDEEQTTYAPELSEQLTCPGTPTVPRQKPLAEQPPGTQSAADLQPEKYWGRTHAPPQHVPRPWSGRKQNVPFGVFGAQAHWPAEHPMDLVAQKLLPQFPQLFGSD